MVQKASWRIGAHPFRVSPLIQHLSCMYEPIMSFPGDSDNKASDCNAGDLNSIPGSRRSSGEENGNPLQYSCLETSMAGRAW